MRESRCLVHGILNFFFAVLLPYLMLLAMVLSALMTPCAGGPHRSSVFVTVLEYLLMLIPLAGYLASVSVLAVRSVKATAARWLPGHAVGRIGPDAAGDRLSGAVCLPSLQLNRKLI